MKHFPFTVVALISIACQPMLAAQASTYIGQESREIKALSEAEISDYLAGKGMGLAKAAELNGYPGPNHVLELASALHLTPEQKARTETLFNDMKDKAAALGRRLVEEERELDRLFASKAITPATLQVRLENIGKLQGQIRQTHLEAHLAQKEILSPQQVERYMELRGYRGAASNDAHCHHHRD